MSVAELALTEERLNTQRSLLAVARQQCAALEDELNRKALILAGLPNPQVRKEMPTTV
jgi:hypothetical protein